MSPIVRGLFTKKSKKGGIEMRFLFILGSVLAAAIILTVFFISRGCDIETDLQNFLKKYS